MSEENYKESDLLPGESVACYDIHNPVENKINRKSYKTPKGMVDLDGSTKQKMDYIFDTIKTSINLFADAVPLDTPVLEKREILLGKYGEEVAQDKLIYELKDQGGEQLCLRYDLTVPLMRYVVQNRINKLKRYQCAKVYRRDQPSIQQGRFREFYQFDYDIIGNYKRMLPEAELLKLINIVLAKLNIPDFIIKVNFRQNLYDLFAQVNVPEEKYATISSAIDKLDKSPWTTVALELEQKGLSSEQIARMGLMLENYVSPTIAEDWMQLQKYITYLKIKNVKFTPSLARGLDYYTGLVLEVVVPNSDVGSIIGGGRYDTLISNKVGKNIPAVGLSFGVSRLMGLANVSANMTKSVGIVTIGDVSDEFIFNIYQQLLDISIPCEIHTGQFKKQLAKSLDKNFATIIIGENEEKNQQVQLRFGGSEKEGKHISIMDLESNLHL